MKRLYIILLIILFSLSVNAQVKFKYGISAGLNLSSAILPDLKVNTNINSVLHGDNVIEGSPQLADFVSLYKAGIFMKLDGKIGAAKLNISYTKTNIFKELDTGIFRIKALDILLDYLDFEMSYNLNLSKHFYISAGYIPSILLKHDGNLNINSFDQRLLSGIGFRFGNGLTLDFNAIAGISEIIDGSYIHNLMIPISLNIPLN